MSRTLQQTDSDIIWHPFTSLEGGQPPLVVSRAEGVYLYTDDGRRILDAVSSWWVNLHGHAQPAIAGAIAKQALELEHVIFAGFTHAPAVRLAEKLLSALPATMGRVFYSDDGSTAVEVALKLAVQYWHNLGKPRRRIVAIEGAYHGDTFGAMAAGDRGPFNAPFHPLLFPVDFIPFPTEANRGEVLRRLEEIVAGGDVAAFIYEPLVQGAGGMRMYSAEVLDKLVAIAKSKEVICVADEVMTGFGRTGPLFATDQTRHKPDLICLSKGITGGFLPMGVTVAARFIVEAFTSAEVDKTFFHGHSYTANPLACAAALASFDLLLNDNCTAQRTLIEQQHRSFAARFSGHALVKDVRVTGTILALELNTGSSSYFNDVRKKILPYFLERGILLRPLGNVIYILPPYVVNASQLGEVYEHIEGFLEEGWGSRG